MKTSKWMKSPSWVDWEAINKKLTGERRERQKKREFMGRLKRGDRWHMTNDPGPW